MRAYWTLAAAGLLLACGNGADTRPDQPSAGETREAALVRFRQGLDSVTELTGGAGDRDTLVQRYLEGLSRSDTAALRSLAVTKPEFAWLYYPSTPQGLPPYDLHPDLMWFLLEERSGVGLGRALEALGGHPLRLVRYHCDPQPSAEGENRIWGPCVVVFQDGTAAPDSARLFSQILERHGQFKFLNYSNKLD